MSEVEAPAGCWWSRARFFGYRLAAVTLAALLLRHDEPIRGFSAASAAWTASAAISLVALWGWAGKWPR